MKPGSSEIPAAPFWEQNTALLRSRYPELAKQIDSSQNISHKGTEAQRCENANCELYANPLCLSVLCEKKIEKNSLELWRLEQTPSGNPTLLYQGSPDSPEILIHSRHDPAREGQRQAEAELTEYEKKTGAAAGTIIVLGFGLGYTAEALAQCSNTLIIVERHSDIFSMALQSRNLEKLLSPGKAVFVMGKDAGAINAALAVAGTQKPLIIKNRALCTLTEEDGSWYDEVSRRINTWASKDEINAATLQRFGKRWTRNLAANREGVLHFSGVKNLKNILKGTGIPVFLAAAGPSLNNAEPYAEEIQSRCVIAAVDTSLRFFARNNIEPDFAVSVDPQYWNSLHLHRITLPHTSLITESAAYPATLKNAAFNRIFFCQSLFPLGRFIEDRTDPKGPLGAGGSVATTAWDFCRLLGPPALWTAGLDLAFPGYHTHFKGALFEETAHAASQLFCPAETLSIRALENGIPFNAASTNGGRVLTDKRLSLYAAWFENQIEKTGQTSQTNLAHYNLSPAGLAVPGFINAQMEELLSLPPRRDEINEILQTVFCRIDDEFNNDRENRKERYSRALTDLTRGLEEIRNIAAGAASAAKNAATNTNQDKTEKVLQKLDKANAAIAASQVKDAAGFLFPAIAELEKELHETNPLKRHLEFSRRFYQSLSESVDYTLKCLRS